MQRVWRLLTAAGVFLGGDRSLLRRGGPGQLVRAFGVRMPIYCPHPYTLYALNPEWRSSDGRSRHNSLGLRGAEVLVPKPVGRVRVVCMGESTTYCTGIDDDNETYPARLQVHLKSACPSTDLEVVNAGVGGYTSIENVLRCLLVVGPLQPDLIVYYYTHNDVHPRRMPKLSRDYREYSRSWYEPHRGGGLRGWIARRKALATGDIGNLVRRYDEYVGRRQSSNVRNNPPEAFRSNITALALIAQAAGARMLFVNPPYRDLHKNWYAATDGNQAYRAVWEHRRVIDDIGRQLEMPVYDLAADMPYPTVPSAFPNEHYLDSVHVNAAGADLMARFVAQAAIARNLV